MASYPHMSRSRLPKSIRKYLRAEKSRIRHTSDRNTAEMSIRALMAKYLHDPRRGMLK